MRKLNIPHFLSSLGIGRAICEQLYKLGASVYAFSRLPEPLAELIKEFPNIKAVTVDLANWKETRDAFKILQGVPIHGLVNNAGVAIIKPFEDMNEEDID